MCTHRFGRNSDVVIEMSLNDDDKRRKAAGRTKSFLPMLSTAAKHRFVMRTRCSVLPPRRRPWSSDLANVAQLAPSNNAIGRYGLRCTRGFFCAAVAGEAAALFSMRSGTRCLIFSTYQVACINTVDADRPKVAPSRVPLGGAYHLKLFSVLSRSIDRELEDGRVNRFSWSIRVVFGREMRLFRYSLTLRILKVRLLRARTFRALSRGTSFCDEQDSTNQPVAFFCRPWIERRLMQQMAENRTHKVDGQMIAAWRKHLEWLRVDLLQIWAAPCFDVEAYARIRYQIRLVIDTARNASDPLSFALLSSPRRRKRRQQHRSVLLTSSLIAIPDDRYRASATRMKSMPPADTFRRRGIRARCR